MVKSEEGTTLNISGGAFTRAAAPRWGITGTVLVYGTTTITGGTFNEKSASPSARVVVTGKVDGYLSNAASRGADRLRRLEDDRQIVARIMSQILLPKDPALASR